MKKEVIIACDFNSKKETFEFLDKFHDVKPFVKIGMELYYSQGAEMVKELKARGHKIFLDLKLHDIPTTVEKSMKVIGGLGVDITNVHAAGGIEMMKAGKAGLVRGSKEAGFEKEPMLIAVTQLTSTSEDMLKNEILIDTSMDDTVMKYGENAQKSGLDGVVCSPMESMKVHDACGCNFVTVTPGIRFVESEKGDQKRVVTPSKAKELGSDYIVIGRPITQSENPVKAYERACMEFCE